MCLEINRPPGSRSSSSGTVVFQHPAQRFRRTTTHFKRLTNPIPLRGRSRLAMEMLFRPVYSGSWICMEKFNSENSSRTYRRELNAPILTDSTDCETTTDTWQPSGRQSGGKEHEFLPLGVQGSTRRGSSESSRMRDGSARGRWLWRGRRSWVQSAFPC